MILIMMEARVSVHDADHTDDERIKIAMHCITCINCINEVDDDDDSPPQALQR